MTNNILRTLGVFLVVALGLACGGGSSATRTVGTFCDQKAKSECDGVADRCLATSDACKAARKAACMALAAQQQDVATRPFRPEKIDNCVNKVAEVYRKSPITPADRTIVDDLCARVFSGTKKIGDPCGATYECDAGGGSGINGGVICDLALAAPLCAMVKAVATDAFCNNPGETCPAAQYCTGTGSRMCTAKKALGENCDAANPCVDTLRCAAAGTCMDRVGIGGACNPAGNECVPMYPYCDTYAGNICDTGFIPSVGNQECVMAFAGTATGGGGSDAAAD